MNTSPAWLAPASARLHPIREKRRHPGLIGLVLFAVALLAAEIAIVLLVAPDVDALSLLYPMS